MPTVTLRYTLPDEQAEFDAAVLGREALHTIWDIHERLRSLLKHGDLGDEANSLAREIRQMIDPKLLEVTLDNQ